MKMPRPYTVLVLFLFASSSSLAAGAATRGAKLSRNCLACRSVEAGQHLTGPSLANIWGRKAGTAKGDRSAVVFASPNKISSFIRQESQ